MNHPSIILFAIMLLLPLVPSALHAQRVPTTVIWSEPGLPSADSAAASPAQLAQIFPDARILPTDQLASALGDSQTRLLILPQGSVIPESAWSAISDFLHRGGNLLVLGGRPFTRAANLDALVWGVSNGRRLSAPLLQIDHFSSGFDGGRWIFLVADLASDFYSSPD